MEIIFENLLSEKIYVLIPKHIRTCLAKQDQEASYIPAYLIEQSRPKFNGTQSNTNHSIELGNRTKSNPPEKKTRDLRRTQSSRKTAIKNRKPNKRKATNAEQKPVYNTETENGEQ